MADSIEMQGKRVLITGATGGIGRVTAREIARQGAEVVVIGRSRDKSEETIAEIKEKTGNQAVSYLLADLSLVAEVRRLADEVKAKYDRLDVLVNNAGALFTSRKQTAEGHEMTFALNHLSYFALTNLLLPLLQAAPALASSASRQTPTRRHAFCGSTTLNIKKDATTPLALIVNPS